jgi:transcriptional regulator with XRE-family HTH domain
VSSPFVRRRRLADELRALREAHDLSADELAKRIHHSRMRISRLENAHGRPDVRDVITILDTLGIKGTQWEEIIRLAYDAAEKGWWDRYGDSISSWLEVGGLQCGTADLVIRSAARAAGSQWGQVGR